MVHRNPEGQKIFSEKDPISKIITRRLKNEKLLGLSSTDVIENPTQIVKLITLNTPPD